MATETTSAGRRYDFDGHPTVILTRDGTFVEDGIPGACARVWEGRGFYGVEMYVGTGTNKEFDSLAAVAEYVAKHLPSKES